MFANAIATGLLLAGAAVAAPGADFRVSHHKNFNPHGHYIDLFDHNNYGGRHFRHELGFDKCSAFIFEDIEATHIRSFKSPIGVTCTFFADIHCHERIGTDIDIKVVLTEHLPHAYQCFTPPF